MYYSRLVLLVLISHLRRLASQASTRRRHGRAINHGSVSLLLRELFYVCTKKRLSKNHEKTWLSKGRSNSEQRVGMKDQRLAAEKIKEVAVLNVDTGARF
jgi:hypothetical protein